MCTQHTRSSGSPPQSPLKFQGKKKRTSTTAIMSSSNIDQSQGQSSTPSQASVPVFVPVAPPILYSVDPVQVTIFLKERERYEREVSSKQAEVPSLKVLPYTASIDLSLLEDLFFMGKFDDIAPEVEDSKHLTDEQIKKFIVSIVSRSIDAPINPAIIKAALQGLQMPMKISDPDARITHYCSDFFERLKSVGCASFRKDNPQKTIKLLMSRLQPAALKREMQERLDFDVNLNGNVKRFIKTLVKEAISCQAYGSDQKKVPTSSSSSGNSRSTFDGNNKPSSNKKLPLCLLPEHKEKGYRHYVKDCKACSPEMKQKLLAEHKSRTGGTAKRALAAIPENSGVIFSATFGNKIRSTVCADIGADANILGNSMVKKFKESGVEFSVETLPTKSVFEMAASLPNGEPASLMCDKAVVVDTELHIRHGSALVLRGVRWLVTNQSVGEPLLGRPLLEALGLNTQEILSAAAEKYSGAVDVSTLMDKDDKPPKGRVARILEGVYHAKGGVDETDLNDEDGWIDLGPEHPAEKEVILSKKIQEAEANGLSTKGSKTLEKILRDFGDVIKLKLEGGPPADIEPLKIHLKADAVPIRTKQRRYPPPKKEFMTRYVRQLSKLGFVKKVSSPEWVSAPLIVPKRPPAMYRLTIDYRPINNATIPTFWPMPNIDAELSDARGAAAFAGIDFCSGYWQAPLHPDSQPLFAFMTPDGVVMPTRTTQGGCNSTANFQEKIEQCFMELRENFKAWLDDFMLFAKNEDQMLKILRRFFEICRNRRLIVSLPKSDFYLKEVLWCGRLINKDGVKFNPKNLSGLQNCDNPRTASELCEFVHGVSWISSTIPRFAERASILRELLEVAYAKANGSRKKKSIAKFQLSDLGWNEKHVFAFNDLQEQLKEATRLTHRDPNMTLCIHTDASDRHWALVATQCKPEELNKLIQDQSHQPLAFLSGTFSDREEHWSTYEKEAFAVVQAFKKLDYLLACDTSTRVFTDHRNLLFTFNPISMEPSLGRHKVLKVVRWALFLSAFTYRIEHVPGDVNTWPDIMTRWMRGYRKPPSIRRVSPAIPFSGVPVPPESPEFQWPSMEEILKTQDEHKNSVPKEATKESGLILVKGAAWIPDDCIDLKLRFLTIAHAGDSGHRGSDATEQALREKFYWKDQREDVRSFVSSCLLCVLGKSGEKIPRPLSTTLHASKPNEVIHFDYLFMGESDKHNKYVLVVKDDLSGYCWLEPTSSASAEHTANVLARWIRIFTTPSVWVSDQGSHFKNEVMQQLSSEHRIRHNFSVAYSPWANGTVENLMRSILSATRAMLSELKLAPQDWACVLPSIATALNQASLSRLGKNSNGLSRSPLEVMTGIHPQRPLLRILHSDSDFVQAQTLTHARVLQVLKIDDLQKNLEEMHKDVTKSVSIRREKSIAAHNKSTNIQNQSFAVGDFVLVRRARDRVPKLHFKWYGPCRITAVYSSLVYGVTSLRGGKTERIHSARLTKYQDSLLEKPVPQETLDLADRTQSSYEVIDKIMNIGQAPDGIFFQVQWEGLPDKRDWTWHPISELYDDTPELVKDFLNHHSKKKALISKAKRHLNLSL